MLSETPSECQMVWIQIRPDVLVPDCLQRSTKDDKICHWQAISKMCTKLLMNVIMPVLLLIYCLLYFLLFVEVLCLHWFYYELLFVISTLAIILKRKLVALLLLSYIMYCYYKCSVALPSSDMDWSEVCDFLIILTYFLVKTICYKICRLYMLFKTCEAYQIVLSKQCTSKFL